MKKIFKKIAILLIIVFIVSGVNVPVFAESENNDVMILFTHDLHSHFLPAIDENGEEYGGYARIMTAVNEQKKKNPDALLLDGGDFAMGSV